MYALCTTSCGFQVATCSSFLWASGLSDYAFLNCSSSPACAQTLDFSRVLDSPYVTGFIIMSLLCVSSVMTTPEGPEMLHTQTPAQSLPQVLAPTNFPISLSAGSGHRIMKA